MEKIIYGIDVSKDMLEYCRGSDGSNERIKNQLTSIDSFITGLRRESVPVHVVVEATGGRGY